MKKRIAAVLVVVSIIIVMGGIGSFALFRTTANQTDYATWTEVPITPITEEQDGQYMMLSDTVEFDPVNIREYADFVFDGTIIDGSEYAVDWYDDNNEYWGPFRKSILTVKVNKVHRGESPSGSDTVIIYYPFRLSMRMGNSPQLIVGNEYTFQTQYLDEEFIEHRNAKAPYDKIGQERYAHVYIANADYDVMPREGNQVILYHEYFSWDEDVVKQQSSKLPETDTILPELAETGYFVAMNAEDFDNALKKMYSSQEALPNADELNRMQSEDVS